MRRFDQRLVQLYDACASIVQRRGILLTQVLLYLSAIVMIGVLIGDHLRLRSWLMFIMDGAAFGGIVLAQMIHCQRYDAYPENARMIQRLNAIAVARREHLGLMFIRLMWFLIMIVDVVVFVIAISISNALDVIVSLFGVSFWYLITAFYLGPGEFNKQHKSVEAHDGVTGDA